MQYIYQLKLWVLWLLVFELISCSTAPTKKSKTLHVIHDTVFLDCNYSFDEAVAGSGAPEEVLEQLQLVQVKYISFDNKTHIGQLLTNKRIAGKLKIAFEYMYEQRFPIGRVIPVVKYQWDDNKSMAANNTYSFCYRDIYYSKHSYGLAVDINPFLNPVRWKEGYEYRQTIPNGAVFEPSRPGTFTVHSPVVHKFKTLGFRWGHSFTQKYDDHHFEK
jgi:hypothetical protein